LQDALPFMHPNAMAIKMDMAVRTKKKLRQASTQEITLK